MVPGGSQSISKWIQDDILTANNLHHIGTSAAELGMLFASHRRAAAGGAALVHISIFFLPILVTSPSHEQCPRGQHLRLVP